MPGLMPGLHESQWFQSSPDVPDLQQSLLEGLGRAAAGRRDVPLEVLSPAAHPVPSMPASARAVGAAAVRLVRT
jgi:hypothetical protein